MKQVISISWQDKFYLDKNTLEWVINDNKRFPSSDYKLSLTDKNKTIVEKIDKNNSYDSEIKALKTLDLLGKRLLSLNKINEQLEQAKRFNQQDKIYLKDKSLNKAKNQCIKYLNELINDKRFTCEKINGTTFKLSYLGKYIQATKTRVIGVRGVVS